MLRRDYIEWQDRSVAIGYLITFRNYGTWLHGDGRGSMDRRYFNRYGSQKIAPDPEKEKRKAGQMKDAAFRLETMEREIVDKAIREVCEFKSYTLFALNIRTEHVHVVTANHGEPDRVMSTFKAYSTRALRRAGMAGAQQKVWSRHGSTRYLWTEDHIRSAVEYVVNGQGGELPTFS